MGTTSTSGWAVFFFLVGFMLAGTLFLGSVLPALLGAACIIVSITLFQKAKALEA
ncbi:MAG: hypothetical protein ACHQX0_07330 [Desulfobaccales bacterium]